MKILSRLFPNQSQAEARAATPDERHALADSLARLRAETEARGAIFAADVAGASERRKAAENALAAAKVDEHSARSAHLEFGQIAQRRINELEYELRNGASPQIDDAIRDWRKRLEKRRAESAGFLATIQDAQLESEHWVALQAAPRKAEALKLEPLTDAELQARLAAIEASIPSPYREVA